MDPRRINRMTPTGRHQQFGVIDIDPPYQQALSIDTNSIGSNLMNSGSLMSLSIEQPTARGQAK